MRTVLINKDTFNIDGYIYGFFGNIICSNENVIFKPEFIANDGITM